MFTPYSNHTTELAASLYASCAVTTCKEQANPLNVVEAKLDVFGDPMVRVCFCDECYRLFGETTEEHEKPDIVLPATEGQSQ